MGENFLFVDDSEESKRALSLLEAHGLLEEVKVVKCRNPGILYYDLPAVKVPCLALSDGRVFLGLAGIEKWVVEVRK